MTRQYVNKSNGSLFLSGKHVIIVNQTIIIRVMNANDMKMPKATGSIRVEKIVKAVKTPKTEKSR